MRVKVLPLVFLAYMFFVPSVQGQVHEVSGKVLNTEGIPIEFATVKLLIAKDST